MFEWTGMKINHTYRSVEVSKENDEQDKCETEKCKSCLDTGYVPKNEPMLENEGQGTAIQTVFTSTS